MDGVDKIAVRQMVDREILNTYMGVKELIFSNISPKINTMVQTMVKPYESKWIQAINDKVDIAMEMSFPSDETPLEEGLENLNNIINEGIKYVLREKLHLPEELVNIDLNQFLENII